MNNIYIINNDFEYEIELNFTNNTFKIDENIYTFDLVDKDKIILYMNKDHNICDVYYTKDSYIYYNDEELLNNFKKIWKLSFIRV
jgi:hypothetical protein